jgi:two-component system CheB/CheR fusion protein
MPKNQSRFHIAALGASAGGLEAYEKFFSKMPADSGMAFVLVPHLDPDHASLMPELIRKATDMPVQQIEEGMQAAPDQVFIVPPDRDLAILNGVFQLMKRVSGSKGGVHMPIDYFFRALAGDAGEYAVGIVLSGMGMDGSFGLRAIKGELGVTFAQDPESAKYGAMPKNAIDTAQVDYVLPPDQMPAQLVNYLTHFRRKGKKPEAPPKQQPDGLQKIFFLVRQQTGHDFSEYKKTTIHRRIERRMNVCQTEKLEEYVHYLQRHAEEVNALFHELLIGVTSFFREPEAFDALKSSLIPLLQEKPRGYTLRAWVPGCASGEEAYSVAIVLNEAIEATNQHCHLQIFATDIDEQGIEKGRNGVYPASIAADVGPERLRRFFVQEENNTYRIQPNIREAIVFAPQNIIKDPPFTNLDLVSCRNLLIYLEAPLQKKLLPLLHYSLKPGGLLFLGGSESIGEFTDLLEPVDKRWKIFSRKEAPPHSHPPVDFPLSGLPETENKGEATARTRDTGISRTAEKALLSAWAPPSVIINEKGEILYIHGRTGRYLEPSPGEARFNIHEMARKGLQKELPLAIRRAADTRQPVTYRRMKVQANGETAYVNLSVRPLNAAEARQRMLMVSFEEQPAPEPAKKGKKGEEKEQNSDAHVQELETELAQTKESLQSTIEELETSNEELKSTNEELQSTNEELQSTNEELETSKEEQQSLNEELNTVNSELQGKITQLTQANNDMKNFLDSIDVPVIFLDSVLRVKRFTSQAGHVSNLIESDIGRPISDITMKVKDIDLKETAAAVLRDRSSHEAELRTGDGRWYELRARPYQTTENVVDGVVFTFVDITRIKQAQTEADRLAAVLRDANDAVIVWNLDGRILNWNRGAEEMYGYSEEEARSMSLLDLVPEDRYEETRRFMDQLRNGRDVRSFKTQRLTREGRILDVWLTVTRMTGAGGAGDEVVTTERDLNWLAGDQDGL